jgi:hypothetical protein
MDVIWSFVATAVGTVAACIAIMAIGNNLTGIMDSAIAAFRGSD